MDTLKQTAVTALLNLPDFTEIDDMIAVLRRLQFHRELAELPTPPPAFLEVAKEYIGSLEGSADSVIIDIGPLVATLNRRDAYHTWVTPLLANVP